MYWCYPQFSWFLLPVLGFIALVLMEGRRRARGLRAFHASHAAGRLAWHSPLAFRALGMVLAALALLGPGWGEQILPAPPVQGRDLLVLLDVSKSMRAEDAKPNRLQQAKQIVAELAAAVVDQGGRVGLIAFADRSTLLCPLTTDVAYYHRELAAADLTSVRLRQEDPDGDRGTRFAPAFARAAGLLAVEGEMDPHPACDLLLVSDGGEDLDDADQAALAELGRRRLAVFTLGVGDPTRDSPIPVVGPGGKTCFLQFQGVQVATRLNQERMRRFAAETEGEYTPASAGAANELSERLAVRARRERAENGELRLPIVRYQWFLIPAVICLLLDSWLRRPRLGSAGPDAMLADASWLRRLVPPRPHQRPRLVVRTKG